LNSDFLNCCCWGGFDGLKIDSFAVIGDVVVRLDDGDLLEDFLNLNLDLFDTIDNLENISSALKQLLVICEGGICLL
jgi:hypothetical protein